MKAARVHELGDADKLVYEEVPTPEPGPGQVLVKHEFIGVNFSVKYIRTGLYKQELPFTAGREAAGVVEAVGPDVTAFAPGDPVCYTGVLGAYADYAAVPAARLIRRPEGVDAKLAATVLNQGMTAYYLIHQTYPFKAGETCLVHAGAGGVGQMLVQMGKLLGGTVIATVSTEEKARVAREAGADHVILYTRADFAEETLRLTGGQGVEVVFDTVVGTTFEGDLKALKPRGMLVVAGFSAGPPPPIDIRALQPKALYLTRAGMHHYAATREQLELLALSVLEMARDGRIRHRVFKVYPLSQAAQAHAELENRGTVGKLLLQPGS